MKRGYLQELYDSWNSEYFGGILSDLRVRKSNWLAFMGVHQTWEGWGTEVILNERAITWAGVSFESVLAHEMIHELEYILGTDWDHGVSFRFFQRMLCSQIGEEVV